MTDRRVDAILFDLDGTLIDSTAVVNRHWAVVCARFGVDIGPVLAVAHGRRSVDIVAATFPAEVAAAAKAMLDELEATDLAGVVRLPGAELLPRLPETRRAVITSGDRQVAGARLAWVGLPTPAVTITAEDVAAGKPDPAGYLEAARRLGVDPARALVVEDAPAGVAAGKAAGMPVLAVATSHDAREAGQADSVVPDLAAVSVVIQADGLVASW